MLNDQSGIQLRMWNYKKHWIKREKEREREREREDEHSSKTFSERIYPCYNLWGKIHQLNGPPSKRSAPQY